MGHRSRLLRALLALALSLGTGAPVFGHELIHSFSHEHAHEHDGAVHSHEHDADHHAVAPADSENAAPGSAPRLVPAAQSPLWTLEAGSGPALPVEDAAIRVAGLDPPPKALRLLLASPSSSLAPPAA